MGRADGRVVKMALGDRQLRLPGLHRCNRSIVRVDRPNGRVLSLARLLSEVAASRCVVWAWSSCWAGT